MGRPIQWARYLAKSNDFKLSRDFFADSPSLNDPVPGGSYVGACMEFPAGDSVLAGTSMSGAI